MTPQGFRDRITRLEAFESILADLKSADALNGGNIETALRARVRDVHQQLAAQDLSSENGRDVGRHLLYREAVDLKAHAVPYLNYERELATRQAELWRFALETTEQLFVLVFDALDQYFAAKTAVIVGAVDAEAEWYTGLVDTGRKGGELVNLGAKLLKRGAQYLEEQVRESSEGTLGKIALSGAELISDVPDDAIDTRDVVQRAIAKHLAPDVFGKDLERILEEVSARYVAGWTEKIRSQTPNLAELKAFAVEPLDAVGEGMFELGPAEQTLALGVGGAVLGTVSLAAGWHTLAYAMAHVFYPAAILVAIGAAGVAWMRKEKDQEKRRQRVRDAVTQYHRHCLLEIDTGKRAELGGKTLREALRLQAATTVQATLDAWQHAISGNLRTDHYRRLAGAFAAHLNLIHECSQLLRRETSSEHSEEGTTTSTI